MRPLIATHEPNYQKGRVITLGLYSNDILSNGRFDRLLHNLLLQHA